MKLSTGLRNFLVGEGSLLDALNANVVVRLYSGTEPASADAAVSEDADLLCTISVDGAGTTLSFEPGPDGTLLKSASETWSGTVDVSGVATWFRVSPPSDAGSQSTTTIRLQGSVALAGADMQLSNTSLVYGATQTIDYFALTVPAN